MYIYIIYVCMYAYLTHEMSSQNELSNVQDKIRQLKNENTFKFHGVI